MPRAPKDPEQRARRNRASTAATLDVESPARPAPPLSQKLFGDQKLHELTRKWWRVIWRSPMAPRWLDADIEGLYLVAILRNRFFHSPTPTLAAEIRQQEARFGLDVLARRRLDWRISGPVKAAEQPSEAKDAPAFPDDFDVRDVLRAVK